MMNKIVIIGSAIVAAVALFSAGVLLDQVSAQEFRPGSMMGVYGRNSQSGYGIGMMGDDYPCQDGSMMGRMMNGRYGGMMPGFDSQEDVEPLTLEQAETAVASYLEAYGDDNLTLGEIMIFDNHAYAQVLNAKTGTGAFELLVDPTTGQVFPEPGPNMMWNTEYGMMSGQYSGMMGGSMMGNQYGGMMDGRHGGPMSGYFGNMMGAWLPDADSEITVNEQDAVKLAQEYLDDTLPGATADDHADQFPGYYTIHVEQDGEVTGMLSVNAYSGQVFLHHWHGDFIEMTGEAHN
jgi:hypothetical protein